MRTHAREQQPNAVPLHVLVARHVAVDHRRPVHAGVVHADDLLVEGGEARVRPAGVEDEEETDERGYHVERQPVHLWNLVVRAVTIGDEAAAVSAEKEPEGGARHDHLDHGALVPGEDAFLCPQLPCVIKYCHCTAQRARPPLWTTPLARGQPVQLC